MRIVLRGILTPWAILVGLLCSVVALLSMLGTAVATVAFDVEGAVCNGALVDLWRVIR